MKKILFLLFLFLIPLSYSISDYTMSCTFKEEFYLQEFTCLEDDCDKRIEKLDNSTIILKILSEDKEINFFKNSTFFLNDFQNNINLISKLCKENIPKEFEKKLTKLNSNEILKILTIENLNQINEDIYFKNSEILDCRLYYFDIIDNWVIEKIGEKNYCTENQIDSKKLLLNILSNPKGYSTNYIFSLILTIALFLLSFGFIIHSIENKTHSKFIKNSKEKTITLSILFLPFSYFWGQVISKYFFTLYYKSVFFSILSFILGLVTLYVLVSIVFFYIYTQKSTQKQIKLKKIRL